MHYEGLVYRAPNPIYAKQPLSGEGAKHFGGRFNPKGVAALYTCFSVETAIREANQVGTLQPTTLVAYKANLNPIFDARDNEALVKRSMTKEVLGANDWRVQMLNHGKAQTQVFANELIRDGFVGLIVPSFVKGAKPTDTNLVIWKWNISNTANLTVIDDDHRLR